MADSAQTSKCSKCGAEGVDLRCGVCYDCATKKESERCERDGHEYDDRPGTAFYDRCVWCDLPRGLAKNFKESHGAPAAWSAPKIFVFANGAFGHGDVQGLAVAEDGTILAAHISSSESWLKRDMGLQPELGERCTSKDDKYSAHYPQGYELVWVSAEENISHSNAAFEAAMEKHNA